MTPCFAGHRKTIEGHDDEGHTKASYRKAIKGHPYEGHTKGYRTICPKI